MVTFADLELALPIQRALKDMGYVTPTPIQERAIPYLLEGRDLLGLAQTGTGKTAAFALPILDHISRHPKATAPRCPRTLILAPTRELASQINDNIRFVFQEYEAEPRRHFRRRWSGQTGGSDAIGRRYLTAAPGRLLDLIGQRYIDLSQLEVLVLDEADRMLDMGFVHDIKRIMALLPPASDVAVFSDYA